MESQQPAKNAKFQQPPPNVTGISPKEGPPGTKVTIRGENLGESARDLIALYICSVDCFLSAEWKSPKKIIARTGAGKGKGKVIAMTKSGGVGTCTVDFRGYLLNAGPLQESAVWVDESKSINPLLTRNRQSSPVTLKDNEDPLGLSDEGSRRRYNEDELLEMFPNSSGNISNDSFSAAWYLLENHEDKRFDDLKAGLAYLKRKERNRAEGPLTFVKQNLTTFMECQDTLDIMHSKLISDDSRKNDSCIADNLILILGEANAVADRLFQDVLKRKDRADSTRNALSVINRFKFLFYLPVTMKKNIRKGDFDLVINDYGRVKSLFGDTEVQIFQRVYKEIEHQISEFRDILQTKLLELPTSFEDQKKLIRYLVELEAPGDPAWECIINVHDWIVDGLYNDCKETHISLCTIDVAKQARMSEIGETPKTSKSKYPKTLATPKTPYFGTPASDQSGWKFKTPQKVQFVEDLTEILSDTFPDMWKLGQAYFSGSLVPREVHSTEKLPPKVDGVKYSKFKQMTLGIVKQFVFLLRAAFLPYSLENLKLKDRDQYGIWPSGADDTPGEWLPHCVRCVRASVGKLHSLELQADALELVQELAFDLRTHCMKVLLNKAIQDVKQLVTKETWVLETDDEFGGTTQLPVLFENIVNETVQYLHEVVTKQKPGEMDVFSHRPIQKKATELCTQLLRSFAVCLEYLAVKQKDHSMMKTPHKLNTTTEMIGKSPAGQTPFGSKSFMSQMSVNEREGKEEDSVLSEDKKLIITLNNCHHTVEVVLPRLNDNLERHGYPETEKISGSVKDAYANLDSNLFEAYIEAKSNPVVGAMEQGMYSGNFDWNTEDNCEGVRSYLKIALVGLIEVHAEVFAISPKFVPRVLYKVVESVTDEFARLLLCVDEFSASGAELAHLELSALESALKNYLSETSRNFLSEAKEHIQSKQPITTSKTVEKKLSMFKQQMKFELMCFR